MIGQLRIAELRDKAQAAMGARFQIKEFHNLVLRTGDVPLDVLGREVDAWVARSNAAVREGVQQPNNRRPWLKNQVTSSGHE